MLKMQMVPEVYIPPYSPILLNQIPESLSHSQRLVRRFQEFLLGGVLENIGSGGPSGRFSCFQLFVQVDEDHFHDDAADDGDAEHG